MFRTWKRLTLLPLMAAALWVGGCTDQTAPADRLLGPTAGPAYSDGAVAEVKYKALKGVYDGKVRSDEQVIQPNAGGNVGVAGNTLIVPAGAISEPTLFVMTLAPVDVDGTTKVQVALRAYAKDDKGKYKRDIGAAGFLSPVELRLTTDWVTKSFDPSQVRVVWAKPDGTQEVTATDRSPDGRYRSYLDHFSDYILAVP